MYPWLLEIGDHTLISWDVKIYNLGRTSIGSGVTISQHAHLCGGTHEYLSGHFDLARTGLTVERNVWIATEAFIGPSVTVHEGSLVAARAVVVKDVGSQTIVGGNPARKIGTLEKPYNFAVDGARETKG
jgi:putative colanic acid biosynthesis acetyltransferase WcaF